MPDHNDDAVITYSLKELLANLQKTSDEGFSAVRTSLATKADRSQVEAINRRLDEHGREIGELKDQQRKDEAAEAALAAAKSTRLSMRQWLLGFVVSVAFVFVALLPYITGR